MSEIISKGEEKSAKTFQTLSPKKIKKRKIRGVGESLTKDKLCTLVKRSSECKLRPKSVNYGTLDSMSAKDKVRLKNKMVGNILTQGMLFSLDMYPTDFG